MKELQILQLVVLVTVFLGHVAVGKVMMCYYTNWSQYRRGKNFFPEDIDTSYCTHLVFSFAKVSNNQLAAYEWNDIVSWDKTKGLYYRFNQLKQKNSALKTLLAVGGYTHGSRPFTAMTKTAANRQLFVSTTITYLREHGFDGLDIDWEYPADPALGGEPQDKANYALLVEELRNAFEQESVSQRRPRLLLTAAVAAGYSKVANGFDIPALNRHLDYINLMAYDLHGSWERKTGHHAGLETSHTDSENLSVSSVAENWARQADRAKILVGLGTYGRTWTLVNPASNQPGAAASGPGTAGQYSGEAGVLFYYEICKLLNSGYTRVFDDETKSPYAYMGNQWITYDDVTSLQHKMEWIRDKGYGGSIVWAIEEDDYDGSSCNQGRYPLLRAIHQCLVDNVNCAPPTQHATSKPPPVVTVPSTTTLTPTTSSDKPNCPSYFGVFRDQRHCNKFWVCVEPGWEFILTCPAPTVFNTETSQCDQPNNVVCN